MFILVSVIYSNVLKLGLISKAPHLTSVNDEWLLRLGLFFFLILLIHEWLC